MKLLTVRREAKTILAKAKLPKYNINYGQRRTLTSLKEETSILILPAYKYRACDALNTETYHDKMANMFTSGPYRTIFKDPTDRLSRKITYVL